MFKIKRASDHHIEQITELAHLLWPDEQLTILKKEMNHFHRDSTSELFICEENEDILGFAHVKLRYDFVEGTSTSPVSYLEGIYVRKLYRKQGIARQLVEVCEDWSRFMNATEFASDVDLENILSADFHTSLGFKEVNRVICYTKAL
ncbi:aminoglycoside 6'-N-acetyltransferase [Alkalibacterium putridalgicola]|jgi:aminoglycoside 6'-N-acetyltransferase I|uniref:Aminoglycoside N(6')-acetyltransferase type 1 n=1 Tax=Alkalibacterium putridalgicola TaxID=426703 RepID=A0A1H7RQK7_9LACT|nr:aminoglycoside 6'-N-acetyltransferase [Alkalibacterium putridalgicola]GEK88933.1 aminoglycoside N(6')-acetyltransferase type 1 [Alkalibacterium putridalgicola]SEL62288.1 aminoglycoside 6'-N-acetyltransferase I [Alkalibacterium putridalgicola]